MYFSLEIQCKEWVNYRKAYLLIKLYFIFIQVLNFVFLVFVFNISGKINFIWFY